VTCMRQVAPDPAPLRYLVKRLAYKEGWKFWLEDMDRGQGSEGLTLVIQRYGPDTYHPKQMMRVNHCMPVPPAAFDVRSWQRWLLDQCLLVERHETCEFFQIHDSPGSEHVVRPYAPSHGPGNDPYLIREIGSAADAETSFRGVRDEGSQGT
jgi:hypothetical protein